VVAGTTSCVPCITRRRKHLPACYTSGTTAPVPITCSTGGLHCKSRVYSCPENFASVHTDCGAHPVPVQWYHVSFPRVKQPRRSADHPRPRSAEVKGRLEVYLYSPCLGPRGLLYNEFDFYLPTSSTVQGTEY